MESDFSGGARAVWVDPLLLMAPLADRAVEAEMQTAARDAEVRGSRRCGAAKLWIGHVSMLRPVPYRCDTSLVTSASFGSWTPRNRVSGPQSNDWLAGDMKVAFAREQGGDVVYMAPASSVPAEVRRGWGGKLQTTGTQWVRQGNKVLVTRGGGSSSSSRVNAVRYAPGEGELPWGALRKAGVGMGGSGPCTAGPRSKRNCIRVLGVQHACLCLSCMHA